MSPSDCFFSTAATRSSVFVEGGRFGDEGYVLRHDLHAEGGEGIGLVEGEAVRIDIGHGGHEAGRSAAWQQRAGRRLGLVLAEHRLGFAGLLVEREVGNLDRDLAFDIGAVDLVLADGAAVGRLAVGDHAIAARADIGFGDRYVLAVAGGTFILDLGQLAVIGRRRLGIAGGDLHRIEAGNVGAQRRRCRRQRRRDPGEGLHLDQVAVALARDGADLENLAVGDRLAGRADAIALLAGAEAVDGVLYDAADFGRNGQLVAGRRARPSARRP